jgi:predicted permease
MRRFLSKLANFFRRERADREMAREMAAHLALIEDDLMRRGMSAEEARLAARRSWGGLEQTRELHRDERSFVWLEQLAQDARHAWRSLAKSPGFVAVAMLSLAFGIGVNTAIFTLVNGILLKELPVPDPHRIVQVKAKGEHLDVSSYSYPAYRELSRQTSIFEGTAAFSQRQGVLDLNGEPRKIDLALVNGGYFAFFGARPALGRLLDDEDDRVEGAHRVCVLSNDAWRAYFGGDAHESGRTVQIDGVPLDVVGVAPADFVGGELQRRYDVWIPTALSIDFNHNRRELANYVWIRVLARLKPGLSFREANARLAAASKAVEAALPKNAANVGATYYLADGSKGFDSWRTRLHDPLVILMGAVSLVLLVACANLANLFLARTNERRQEFAIKLALGVSRWRLMRQLAMETLALAAGGGAAAILLARGLTRLALNLFNAGRSYQSLRVTPDRTVLAFTLGACVATALAAGLYPAWQASRADAAEGMKGAAAGGPRRALVRRVLILAQVMLATVLLFGASLFTHSLRNLKLIDLGLDIDRVLSINIAARGSGRDIKPVVPPAALAEALARVRQLPQVESAAYSSSGVLSGDMMGGSLNVLDGARGARAVGQAHHVFAGPGYFATFHMRMLRGRDFTFADRAGSPPVAILNQNLASRAWPGEDPIGKHLSGWGPERKAVEVVGVVANGKYQRVSGAAPPVVYEPFDQMSGTGGALEVRCRGSLGRVERDIRSIIKTVAPAYQVSDAGSVEALRDNQISQQRLLAFLADLFGALGAALALVGIYGLISYSVTRRTREVGIRISVGARTVDVLWLFTRESLALTAAGVALGAPLALALASYAKKMLYEVPTNDPAGMAVTVALLALGAALAAYFPSRRAARIDPVRALRYE